ncbi:MAG: hypothetical protein IAC55_02050 [Tyzzerella sp.]|uniref:Membrane fusion protein n=1 Tax=Candidatus Fimicola merdigallinarum TaxID=2840819 RepID=A0A9D9H2K3_9FIRM|nr:hypothetical protein [Candidatus Fimicola merdigallinarum]
MSKKYSSGSGNYNNRKYNANNRNTYSNVTPYSSIKKNGTYSKSTYNRPKTTKSVNKTSSYPQKNVNRKKPKPRRNGHRAFIGIMFTVLFIYLLGYLITFINKPHISVESVGYGTIDVPKTLNGIVIRDEKVFKSPISGQPVFAYSDNERVKKDASVCVIKKDDTADALEEKIQEIDKDILEKQMQREDLSVFKGDIDRIETDISNTIDTYIYKLSDGGMSEVYSMKNRVNSQITMRNNIWLTENNKSVSQLNEERKGYQSQLADSIADIRSDVSGVVSFAIDGMEESLPYDDPKNVTEEQTKAKVTVNHISKSQNVDAETPIFKIVESNIWYVTAYIPKDVASNWEVGDRKVMLTTTSDENVKINVRVDSMEQLDNNTKVVFKSNESIEKVIDVRNIEFTIEDEVFEGIKVPNKAIVEKTLLKIPAECVRESNGDRGVLKSDGDETKFVSLIISKEEEANLEENTGAFVYVLQDFETLRIGDTILKGTGENAEKYTISEVETDKGVYVVNSSVADFKIIEVIASNSEYSIVKAGSTYGLKVYDNIVSDAKNIQESDSIY